MKPKLAPKPPKAELVQQWQTDMPWLELVSYTDDGFPMMQCSTCRSHELQKLEKKLSKEAAVAALAQQTGFTGDVVRGTRRRNR